jgi:hypothetical protein
VAVTALALFGGGATMTACQAAGQDQNDGSTDENVPPEQRVFLLHRSQYKIIDTWYAMGMIGTGSKDIEVSSLEQKQGLVGDEGVDCEVRYRVLGSSTRVPGGGH